MGNSGSHSGNESASDGDEGIPPVMDNNRRINVVGRSTYIFLFVCDLSRIN